MRLFFALCSMIGFGVFALGVGMTDWSAEVNPGGGLLFAGGLIMWSAVFLSWQLDRMDYRRRTDIRD